MLPPALSLRSKTAEAVAESLEKSLDLASFEEMDPSLGASSSVGHAAPCFPFPFRSSRFPELWDCSPLQQTARERRRYPSEGAGGCALAAEGHHTFYEREVPFELRSSEGSDAPQEVGALEAIKVKILIHVRDAPPTLVWEGCVELVVRLLSAWNISLLSQDVCCSAGGGLEPH
jgi:hypothetical protein